MVSSCVPSLRRVWLITMFFFHCSRLLFRPFVACSLWKFHFVSKNFLKNRVRPRIFFVQKERKFFLFFVKGNYEADGVSRLFFFLVCLRGQFSRLSRSISRGLFSSSSSNFFFFEQLEGLWLAGRTTVLCWSSIDISTTTTTTTTTTTEIIDRTCATGRTGGDAGGPQVGRIEKKKEKEKRKAKRHRREGRVRS